MNLQISAFLMKNLKLNLVWILKYILPKQPFFGQNIASTMAKNCFAKNSFIK